MIPFPSPFPQHREGTSSSAHYPTCYSWSPSSVVPNPGHTPESLGCFSKSDSWVSFMEIAIQKIWWERDCGSRWCEPHLWTPTCWVRFVTAVSGRLQGVLETSDHQFFFFYINQVLQDSQSHPIKFIKFLFILMAQETQKNSPKHC